MTTEYDRIFVEVLRFGHLDRTFQIVYAYHITCQRGQDMHIVRILQWRPQGIIQTIHL